MDIFSLISLFGGLAMFLYGMRMMGDGLKESSSGALKKWISKVTDKAWKAFFVGLIMTAVIQSSTATIVITSGLVGAGIITLHQSLGIIIGANVGTTVTGQIIRLLDLNTSGASFLQLFKPSTLAPLALIIGIILLMGMKFKGSDEAARIAIGFGILFSGLLNMTEAVSALTKTGIIESLFANLDGNPVLGYLIGAGVAFVLQSSSATIGILQAFSTSGRLVFSGIYAVLVGIYLGDCVTTAIVCNIGAKPEAKRVGIVNILFNLSETVLILIGVNLLHSLGFLDGLWNRVVYSGDIANTNTVFNLSCAILMFPMLGVYEKISGMLVKSDETKKTGLQLAKQVEELNPVFLKTPALALSSCYDVLNVMLEKAGTNVNAAFDTVKKFDAKTIEAVRTREEEIDQLADQTSNYLVQISAHATQDSHVALMNYYFSLLSEFERMGDHAMNIAEYAEEMHGEKIVFSEMAIHELNVLQSRIDSVIHLARATFEKRDAQMARHIEPLEEVVDDMVSELKHKHLDRLMRQECSVLAGTEFLNMLSDIERISDICSNVGVETIALAEPELKHRIHDYVAQIHSGSDPVFNQEYKAAYDQYFAMLENNQKDSIEEEEKEKNV